MGTGELIAHALFSALSGLSTAATGFGCDVAIRELFAVVSSSKPANGALSFMGAAPTPINSALSAALITAVQAILRRRLINGSLLLNTLPLTFVGVVLSLNSFSASVRAAFVPSFGACLLGLSLTVLWVEVSERRHKTRFIRESTDNPRQQTLSWTWCGVVAVASLAAGLLSGWCPPPGPAFTAVLLMQGQDESLVCAGEWRATASLVTFSACILRMGLLLLENGASVDPLPEISVLLMGGFVGLGCGNVCLAWMFHSRESGGVIGTSQYHDAEQRRTPPAAVFRRCIITLALLSSIAMATGGAPAALTVLVHPLALAALMLTAVVTLVGLVWGCREGAARDYDGAREAYGEVARDDNDVEVELTPFTAEENGADGNGGGTQSEYRDEYLDEEDGYLADEGETEGSKNIVGRGAGYEVDDAWVGGEVVGAGAVQSGGEARANARLGGGTPVDEQTGSDEGEMKEVKLKALPAHSLFPAGHTMEL